MAAGTLLALLLLKGWPAIAVRWQPVAPELPALRDLADDESDKEEEEEDPAIRPPAHIIAKAETLVLFQRVVQTKPELLQHIWRSQHMMANFNEQPLGREFLLNEHQIKINAQPLSMCLHQVAYHSATNKQGLNFRCAACPLQVFIRWKDENERLQKDDHKELFFNVVLGNV